MRTTLELPIEIYQRVKITAIQRGVTMKSFFERAVLNELSGQARTGSVKPGKRRPFPTMHLKNRAPIDITNTQTEEAILGGFTR